MHNSNGPWYTVPPPNFNAASNTWSPKPPNTPNVPPRGTYSVPPPPPQTKMLPQNKVMDAFLGSPQNSKPNFYPVPCQDYQHQVQQNRYSNGSNGGVYQQYQYYPQMMPNYANSSPNYNKRGNYNNYYNNKRRNDAESNDSLRKPAKKRKKPLSQNIPQRKDWSVEDAKRAIEIEREYNKRSKSHSLIIKFPDTDLNRDIVSGFHPAIESVHFQQPSTPRFCFVSLKEDVKPDEVIKILNKTPFGQGYLTAEYKKDRDEELNIGPEDIDPLTLYVGNLAQEVIKEDVVRIFPKNKRVDIGFAKKMKYTRYAFVSFRNIEDSIEAFKANHAGILYSKSLIVRFRRLHGTVGMPGESRVLTPPRSDHEQTFEISQEREIAPWDAVDVNKWTENSSSNNSIKQEPWDEDSLEEKPPLRLYPGSLNDAFAAHKPISIKEENVHEEIIDEKPIIDISPSEIKQEPVVKNFFQEVALSSVSARKKNHDIEVKKEEIDKNEINNDEFKSVTIKTEPEEDIEDEDDDDGGGDLSDEDSFTFDKLLQKIDRSRKEPFKNML